MAKIAGYIFFFGFILAYLLGNLYRPVLLFPEIHVNLLDIFVIMLGIYSVLFCFSRLTNEYKTGRFPILPALVFLGIGLFSLILSLTRFSLSQVFTGGLYLFRLAGYILLPITLPVVFSYFQRQRLGLWISAAIVFVGLFQYLFFPDVRFLEVAEWDPHFFRVVGSLLDPGFTALLLCFILFRIWFCPVVSNRKLNLAIWAGVYILFALTYSRSGYLAFLSGWAWQATVSRSLKKILFPLVLIVLTVLLLPRSPGGEGVKLERTSSIVARITNWNNSLKIFLDHPVLGVGFNTYRYAQKQYGFLDNSVWLRSHAGAGADSSLLFVAATTGLAGLSAYLIWLIKVWKHAPDALFRTFLVSLLVHSAFLNSLFYPYVLFWIFLNWPKKPEVRDCTPR